MSRRPEHPPSFGLVLIRFTLGCVACLHGWRFLQSASPDGRFLRRAVEESLAGASPFFRFWGESVLLENPDAFAFLLRIGVLACGISFVLGAFVRPAGWCLGFFCAQALVYTGAARTDTRLLFLVLGICALGCAIGGAGRRLGLDRFVDRRFPSWVTWTQEPDSSFLSG